MMDVTFLKKLYSLLWGDLWAFQNLFICEEKEGVNVTG